MADRTPIGWDQALTLADAAAGSAIRRYGADVAVDCEDVASEALARLVARAKPLTRSSVHAAVRYVTREYWRARYADRALSLDAESGSDGGTLADMLADAGPSYSQDQDDTILTASIGDLWVRVPLDAHGLDVDRAVITDSGGTVIGTGRSGVRALETVRRIETKPTAHGIATQQANAADRDMAVLAVSGLPWDQALAVLAEQGIVMKRGALRQAISVANRRINGGTARG